jgi:GTPase SAR1 family protein
VRPLPSPRLHCPYCYERFAERAIEFRCTGRPSARGRTCAVAVDDLLRARLGFDAALPPVFPGDGRAASAECPACGSVTTTRVCPACHSRLPVHFGKVRSRLIALVGAKESGKTVFMTVLVHELMHRTGDRLNAAISGADDNTRHAFAEKYENPLYRQSRLLQSTTTSVRDRAPLVFRFTTEGRGPLRSGTPRHTLLSFFDTAGEDLRSQRSVEENVRYLAAADGVVLLLDPLQMRGARDLAAPGARLPKPGIAGDDPATVLENITDLILAKGGKRPTDRIAKPLAVVFTKMDTLTHDLKETSPLRRPAPETPYFDERDGLEVHTEIQRLLSRWEGSRIDKIVRMHYRRYRYFGVSALGETPTADNRVSPRGIRPYRVTDPFMWILAEFGAIRTK